MEANSSRARVRFCSSVSLAEMLGHVGQGDELVGEDLTLADGAGDVPVGFQDALERGCRKALDALVHGLVGARSAHCGGRGVVAVVGVVVVVSMVEAMPTFF